MADSTGSNTASGQIIHQPRERAVTMPSSIAALIPKMVRSRIPVLPSIGQSIRKSMRQPVRRGPLIPDDERIQELSGSSSRSSSAASSVDGVESPDSLGVMSIGANILDTKSGVNWEISSTGVRLWLSARSHAANNPNANPILLRRMHLDAVKYMNMALPQDMSPFEVRQLSESLPEELRIPQNQAWAADVPPPQPPNILRRGISQLVFLCLTIVALLIPHLINVFRACVRYERRNHLTERVLANGIILTDVLGERGIDVKDAMVRLASGRVGALIVSTSFWVLDGVVGGFRDGIQEVQNQPPTTAQI